MTIQCCDCKRYKSGNIWTKEPENPPEEVSHSYCPACEARQRAQLSAEMSCRTSVEQALYVANLV